MIRLILMRHGNTFEATEIPVQIGAQTDLPLTKEGKRQAVAMAAYLNCANICPKVIYAGNLSRQKESAKIIGENFKLLYLEEPALTEIDYGLWEGLIADEIAMRWPKEYSEWINGKWPDTIFRESFEERMSALNDWLNRLRKEARDPVLAITSNGILRLLHNEKVKTGHFCEIDLLNGSYIVRKWNVNPIHLSNCN